MLAFLEMKKKKEKVGNFFLLWNAHDVVGCAKLKITTYPTGTNALQFNAIKEIRYDNNKKINFYS